MVAVRRELPHDPPRAAPVVPRARPRWSVPPAAAPWGAVLAITLAALSVAVAVALSCALWAAASVPVRGS